MKRHTTALIVGLVFAACGGDKPKPATSAPATPPPVADPAAPAGEPTTPAVAAADPVPDSPKKAPPEPKTPVLGPDTALVMAEGKLKAIDVATGKERVLTTVDADFCRADPRAGGVWLSVRPPGADEYDHGNATFYDLSDGRSTLVAEGLGGGFALAYPDEVVGLLPAHMFDVEAVLALGPKPKLIAQIGCEGDGAWNCYEDAVEETGLLEEIVERVDRIKAIELKNTDVLAQLARRAAGSAVDQILASPDEPDENASPLVVIDTGTCLEEPSDCGRGVPLPGGLLEIIVANDRGDYYHESHQLYDTAAKVFVDADDPSKTSKTPLPDETQIEWVLIAPSGRAWLTADKLVVRGTGGAKATVTPITGACGWYGTATEADGVPMMVRGQWTGGLPASSDSADAAAKPAEGAAVEPAKGADEAAAKPAEGADEGAAAKPAEGADEAGAKPAKGADAAAAKPTETP